MFQPQKAELCGPADDRRGYQDPFFPSAIVSHRSEKQQKDALASKDESIADQDDSARIDISRPKLDKTRRVRVAAIFTWVVPIEAGIPKQVLEDCWSSTLLR